MAHHSSFRLSVRSTTTRRSRSTLEDARGIEPRSPGQKSGQQSKICFHHIMEVITNRDMLVFLYACYVPLIHGCLCINIVNFLFSGIPNSTIHFYGNDGVCIFKYLVTRDDPQWVFSTSILLVNFLCFIFILVSYGYINFKTRQSSRNVGAAVGRRGTNRALQAKISAIILTDFFCWVPLSIVSFLHLAEAINASSWYPFFSILIIPINSVINPLLYD